MINASSCELSNSESSLPSFGAKPLLFKNHPNFGKRARKENRQYRQISKEEIRSNQILPLAEEEESSEFNVDEISDGTEAKPDSNGEEEETESAEPQSNSSKELSSSSSSSSAAAAKKQSSVTHNS